MFQNDTDIPASDLTDCTSFEPGDVSITLQFKKIISEDKKVFSQLRVDLKVRKFFSIIKNVKLGNMVDMKPLNLRLKKNNCKKLVQLPM